MKKPYNTFSFKFSITLLFVILSTCVYAQRGVSILDQEITITSQSISLSEFVILLDENYGIDLSFNAVHIDENKRIKIDPTPRTLRQTLPFFLTTVNYELSTIGRNKVLIIIWPKEKYKTFTGIVRDKSSGESLSGVLVYTETDNQITSSTYTQRDGIFKIKLSKELDTLQFSFLGYDDFKYPVLDKKHGEIFMQYTNEFAPVVIESEISDEYSFLTGSKIINISKSRFETQLSNENDIVTSLKMESGVQSGNEGEKGFNVRGATNDNNLMLLDGVPLHEINHSLGLSSVVYPSAISTMELHKESAPARYGGRVGAVLDIRLKNGNENKQEVDFEIDDKHITFSLNGPMIKNKLTYNFYLRESIIDTYLPIVFNRFVKNLDSNSSISYGDLLGKFTYNTSDDSKLEFLLAYNRDKMQFSKTTEDLMKLNTDFINNWYWNNKLFSLKYSKIFSSTFKLEAQVAKTQYINNTGGSYKFYGEDVLGDNVLNFYSTTNLDNTYANLNLDYYRNENHTIHAGINYHIVSTKATILQDQTSYNYGLQNVLNQSSPIRNLKNDIFSLYLENIYYLNDKIKLFTGIRLSHFDLLNYHIVLLPRFKMSYQWNDELVSFLSYSKNVQYSHVISNSGIGAPIQFHYGSDDRLNPVTSHQVSLSNVADILKNRIEFTAYYKSYSNVVDYSVTSNLFAVDYNSGVNVIFDSPDEWRYYVTPNGQEYAYGAEVSVRRDLENFSGWFTYSYSRHHRRIVGRNNGKLSRAKYDRPLDFNIGLNYKFNDKWAIGSQFTYGSGNISNVSFELYDSIAGFPHLADASGNTYRLPSYQKLNLYARYKYQTDNSNLVFNFGVNNVYNRQNVFYLYLYSDQSNKLNIRRVSLFPILPVLNFKYSF